MKRYTLIIIFSIVIFASCSPKNPSEEPNTNETSQYCLLLSKFKDRTKHTVLEKMVYYPTILYSSEECQDLYFELRIHPSLTWEYEDIYIHNDEIDFVLPLSDYFIYWKMSGENAFDPSELTIDFCFEKEFNNLLKATKAKGWLDAYGIIEIIMKDMLGFFTVTELDIPKLKEIAIQTIEDEKYNENCKSKILNNVSRIERELETGDRLVYSDGQLTYLISIVMLDDVFSHIEIEVLNCECYFRLVI